MISVSNTGKRIKERRESLGWTQLELGRRLGYTSKTTISKIENGERDIPRNKLIGIAEIMMTTPEYLMGLSDEPNATSIKVQSDDELLMIAKKLKPEHYEMLLAYAKLLDKS